jgi:hypothetical protein
MNTIVLEGGLGNRMRVAAAAYTMTQLTGVPCRVLWTRQWGMHCRFDDLFQTFDKVEDIDSGASLFSLRDAEGLEQLLFARAKVTNLWLPRLAQRLCYRRIILSPQIYYLQRDGFDFSSWFHKDGGLMMAYRDFCKWDDSLLPRLFRPLPVIEQEVQARAATFTPHTIGLHIRRTDNQESIDASPNELFFEVVNRQLEQFADLHVYLATDDEPTKEIFRQRYGNERIQTALHQATRNNVDGIREALIEMLLLARTSHVYGSAGSTFSEMAVKLVNTTDSNEYSPIPLTILNKNIHS